MRALFRILACLAAGVLLAGPVGAQQAPDPDADLTVARPVWPAGTGPRVVIDGGHHNFHTVDGRFAPFAAVLRNDGYRVEGRAAAFTAESLKDVDILVVSNALNAVNDSEDGWRLPTPSAFSPAEITAVKAWVEGGGSLLLIADHMPFAGAAQDLAATFGFALYNGFALRPTPSGPDLFSRAEGTLTDDPVTRGRDDGERIDRLRTFTGSAFRAPAGARPLIILPRGYQSLEPTVAWEFDDATPRRDVAGALQGAVLRVGKGRVAMFGEAAMFSAQVAGPKRNKMGFNAPDADRNKPFLLNLVRWLAGVLPD
jgi:hypothetical protein